MKRTRISLIAGCLAAIVIVAAIPAAFAARHAAQTSAANCERGQLSVRSNGTNGAAGTIFGAWVFKNVSRTACVLDGYPDVQLFGVTGRPFRTTVKRDLSPGPAHVTLTPGASATFRTTFSDVASGPTPCPRSAVAQITAPNASASLYIPAQMQPCRGVVHVSAVFAGVHPA